MKKKILLFALIFILMSASILPAFAMESNNYILQTAIINIASTQEKSSTLNYELYSDLGQATPMESANYALRSGNIYTFFENMSIKNLGSGKLFSVTNKPKNVPNPFRPGRNEGTTIIYNLSTDTSVKMVIYDITGKALWQRSFNPGTEGGKAGQNNVFWDGKNDFGETVGNGVYIYMITSGSKILSKGQMAVMD